MKYITILYYSVLTLLLIHLVAVLFAPDYLSTKFIIISSILLISSSLIINYKYKKEKAIKGNNLFGIIFFIIVTVYFIYVLIKYFTQ